MHLPFPDDCFDVIVAGDCIYHQWVDDVKAVREFFRVLKPGGILIVNVAAFEFLRSKHDEAVMTGRRYTCNSLRKLLKSNGFHVDRLHYWNSLLFLPRALLLLLGVGDSEESDLDIHPVLNVILRHVMEVELACISRGVSFPFGTSVMGRAVKPMAGHRSKKRSL